MTTLDPHVAEPAGARAPPQAPEELPYLLTTADVAALLRCDALVARDLADGRREKQILAMAGRWLRGHAVPGLRAGKHRIYRREAVLAALAAAEKHRA